MLPPLTDPVLLVALGGWFDAAGVATSALRLIAGESNSVVVGEIDPDRFYDFTVARPTVENVDGERQIVWPANVFRAVRTPAPTRDLVALDGRRATRRLADLRRRASSRRSSASASSSSSPSAPSPTPRRTRGRPPWSAAPPTRALAATFGLAGPTYQGPTGVIGVLHGALEAHGIPSVSLRVGVPGLPARGRAPPLRRRPRRPHRPRRRRPPAGRPRRVDPPVGRRPQRLGGRQRATAWLRRAARGALRLAHRRGRSTTPTSPPASRTSSRDTDPDDPDTDD